jgi:multicomponent Na+:H+ antiporter subunit D
MLFLNGIRTQFVLTSIFDYQIAFHIEVIGIIFLDLLSVLWIAALMYTPGYLQVNTIGKTNQFLFFLNLSVVIAVFIALSANLFTMFVLYELLTVSTAPLVAHEGGEKANKGLYRYLKTLILSSLLLFLPAMLIIYIKIGHGNFVYDGFIEGYFSKNESIILLIMFIFGINKTALFPLHKWLPAAMVAPHPVSALLHAVVVVKAGLFCIYKVIIYVFGFTYLNLLFPSFNWVILFPAVTMIYSGLKALRLDNIKMILAYSTINQLSIALISAFMFTPKAMGAALLHMLSHSFSKICLFYTTGAIYSLSKAYQVEDLRGMAYRMPKTSAILLLSTLSLIGIPPLAGFISKFYIIMAAASNNNLIVAAIVAISTILTALYMIKMIIVLYSPIKEEAGYGKNKLVGIPRLMGASLIICGLFLILFFLLARYINHFLLYL